MKELEFTHFSEATYAYSPFVEERHIVKGELHRDPAEGPALIRRGSAFIEYSYYLNGRRHREDGPALIRKNLDTNVTAAEAYFWHGEIHRDPRHGAALIQRWKNGALAALTYFIYGQGYRDPEDGAYYIGISESGDRAESWTSDSEDTERMKDKLERLSMARKRERRLGYIMKARAVKIRAPSP